MQRQLELLVYLSQCELDHH